MRAPLLLLLSLFLLAGQAHAQSQPCRLRGLEHEARCDVLKRPLDPAHPDGVQIDVHYAVVPAGARSPKADPVFFFAGGPGQSAIELAGQAAALFARLGQLRDIVLVDQRGTGRSAPLMCERDDPAAPLAEQLDPSRQLRQLRACAESLRRLPHGDLRFYTTSIAVADAEAVRQALGAARINLVGGSYGTRAVLEYMRQFPHAARRAVIDGVAPPDMALPLSMALDTQAAFDAALEACTHDAACRQRHPGLQAQWQRLLESLPRTVTLPHPLTGRTETLTMTRELLLSAVRAPLYSPAMASGLPQAIADAAEGRFDMLAALSSSVGGRRGSRVASGMHFSVVCAEDMPRVEGSAKRPATDFANQAHLYTQVCADWPRGAVPPAFYTLQPAPAATLVLSGGIDPVTPPRHGERVAKALGAKARHVVVPNAGHGVIGLDCMRDVVFRFIDATTDEGALEVDAGCAANVPRPMPFAPYNPEPKP